MEGDVQEASSSCARDSKHTYILSHFGLKSHLVNGLPVNVKYSLYFSDFPTNRDLTTLEEYFGDCFDVESEELEGQHETLSPVPIPHNRAARDE